MTMSEPQDALESLTTEYGMTGELTSSSLASTYTMLTCISPLLNYPRGSALTLPCSGADCWLHVANGPPGFHGNSIAVDGEVVARLIHRRLTLKNSDEA